MFETQKRTIIRAIMWRFIAILITIPFTGFSTAISLHVFLTIAHYLYERCWLKVKWGVNLNKIHKDVQNEQKT